jgi:catalase
MSGTAPNVTADGPKCPVNHQNGNGNASTTPGSKNYEEDRNASSKECLYTTSNGVPMPHPYGMSRRALPFFSSLTRHTEVQRVGPNGPLLLQDFHLIDLLSHFDRERIPERVVHG